MIILLVKLAMIDFFSEKLTGEIVKFQREELYV